jgi:hypothetical protein
VFSFVFFAFFRSKIGFDFAINFPGAFHFFPPKKQTILERFWSSRKTNKQMTTLSLNKNKIQKHLLTLFERKTKKNNNKKNGQEKKGKRQKHTCVSGTTCQSHHQ